MSTSYLIKTENGQELTFEIHDKRSTDLSEISQSLNVPDWVKLEHHQCKLCPFKTNDTKFCPAVYELQDIINECRECVSFDRVELSRVSGGGKVTTETDMQKALFAVIAEKAISSACTVLNSRYWSLDYYTILTTPENLFYRSISSYLARQFLLSPDKCAPDLEGHLNYLDEVIDVFGSLLERIRGLSVRDANNNALVRIVMSTQLLINQRDKWLEALKDKMKEGVK